MKSMVEIVARALCMAKMNAGPDAYPPGFRERRADTHWPQFSDDARAAIAAMREPTDEMVKAGECEVFEHRASADEWALQATKDGWQAMIDEALK